MKNYEIKQAFKNLPDAGLPDIEQVMCHEYEQCEPNIYWQNFMLMGYVGTYLKTRSYIRIKSLPELKSTDVILDSSLRMYVEGYAGSSGMEAGAYVVTGDSYLDYTGINLLHPEPSCIHIPSAHFFAGLHILRNEYLFACI